MCGSLYVLVLNFYCHYPNLTKYCPTLDIYKERRWDVLLEGARSCCRWVWDKQPLGYDTHLHSLSLQLSSSIFKNEILSWLPRSWGDVIILSLWYPGYSFLHLGAQVTGENRGK